MNDAPPSPQSTDTNETLSPIETFRRNRQACCYCDYHTSTYSVRDFPFIYDQVQSIHLFPRQKNMLLRRYVHIMDKVKNRFGCYSWWFTCSKTCLIIGNITIPSIMSIQALIQHDDVLWMVLFWVVWALSIFIAIISSFVTFCNTQKKYNLFNQFNTKIQRELWAYITLTGRYRITKRHLDMMGDLIKCQHGVFTERHENAKEYFFSMTPPPESPDNEEAEDMPLPRMGDSAAPVTEESSNAVTDVEMIPRIMDRGHILMYRNFMNRLENLYRYLTNSNIDIELEDMVNVDSESENAALQLLKHKQKTPPGS